MKARSNAKESGLDRPFLEGLPALGQRGPDDVGNARKVFSMCRLANNFLSRPDVALPEKRVPGHTGMRQHVRMPNVLR